MLKNKIPLHVFICINLLILSLLPIALAITELSKNTRYSYSGDWIELAVIMVVGFAMLFTALGYFYKGKRSRLAMNIILIILFCFVGFMVFIMLQEFMRFGRFRFRMEAFGAIVFLVTVPLGVFLFINNGRVIDEMNEGNQAAKMK